MAGNARGKIKEEMEGMHSNLQWLILHSERIKALLGETHPEIQTMCVAWTDAATTWDELLNRIYATI